MLSSKIPPVKEAVIALAALVAGCGLESESPVGIVSAPIVSGETDFGDPAVVALTVQGGAFCSGTLIAPTVVITAAHCIDPASLPVPVTSCQVFFGTNVEEGGVFVDVAEGLIHPDFAPNSPTFDVNDVALVRMTQASDFAPVALAKKPMDASFIGKPTRIAGFGRTSSAVDDAGIKRQGTAVINDIQGTFFSMSVSPSATGNGDSGGPTFLEEDGVEVLGGIHSRGDYVNESDEERVDLHATFVADYLAALPAQCYQDGKCADGCGHVDPDCPCAADGFCDDSCPDAVSDPDCEEPSDAGGASSGAPGSSMDDRSGSEAGGCGVGAPAPRSLAPALLVVAALALASSRRMRSRTR